MWFTRPLLLFLPFCFLVLGPLPSVTVDVAQLNGIFRNDPELFQRAFVPLWRTSSEANRLIWDTFQARAQARAAKSKSKTKEADPKTLAANAKNLNQLGQLVNDYLVEVFYEHLLDPSKGKLAFSIDPSVEWVIQKRLLVELLKVTPVSQIKTFLLNESGKDSELLKILEREGIDDNDKMAASKTVQQTFQYMPDLLVRMTKAGVFGTDYSLKLRIHYALQEPGVVQQFVKNVELNYVIDAINGYRDPYKKLKPYLL